MPQDDVRAEKADIPEPGNGGPAVAPEHLLKLDNRLRNVNGHRKLPLGRDPVGLPEQPLGAGVNLGRGKEPPDAAVGPAVPAVDDLQRPAQTGKPARLIPLVEDLFAVGGVPAAGAVERADVNPQADTFGLLGDVFGLGAELADGRAAGSD